MNDRLLKESDVIEAFKGRESLIHDVYTATAIIKSVPTADRPQGEWELVGERTQYRRCPYCKRIRAFQDTRFCDWCGARMKGADDDIV